MGVPLTPEERATRNRKIRSLYATGHYSYKEIGDLVHVGSVTIWRTLPPEDREAVRKLRIQDTSARYGGIVEEWKTGEYTLDQLAQRWDRNRERIGKILRKAGISAGDPQYRNKRIRELYAAGEDTQALAKRFGLSEGHITKIVGRPLKHTKVCPICGDSVVAMISTRVYCSDKCRQMGSRHFRNCRLCGKRFSSYSHSQKCCSPRCGYTYRKAEKVERDLQIRELKRAGSTYRELGKMFDLCRHTIQDLCRLGADRSRLLAAVETVRRHKGKAWISQTARFELRRATGVLEAEGLAHLAGVEAGEEAAE